jgi:hypothetical protein
MKKLLHIWFAVLLVSVLIAGKCKKDEAPEPTKTELITKASWKFNKALLAGGADITTLIPACQRDNVANFASNGTGTNDEGASKCQPSDPQTTNFTWNFQSNESILFVSTPLFTGGSSNFTLVSLTATELVLSQTITLMGSPQTVTVYFVH